MIRVAALLIHGALQYTRWRAYTPLEVVAVKVIRYHLFDLLRHNRSVTKDEIWQIPYPFLLGDFIVKHPLWNCNNTTDQKGS